MHLWLVIRIFGNVAMSVGPLPYGIDECEVRRAERDAETDQIFIAKDLAHDPAMIIDGKRVQRGDVVTSCEMSRERPR